MELVGWNVRALGHLSEYSTSGLQPGLNVLVAENEFGKSTLRHFIAWTLFGYPERKNNKDFKLYEPVSGATAGGSVVLRELSLGEFEIQIERSQGTKDIARITSASELDSALDPERLLGDVTVEFYRAVFAVGARDLQEQTSLDESQAIDRVRAASMTGGGASAIDALKNIQGRREVLLKTRSGTLYQAATDLKEARGALREAQSRSKGVAALQRDLDQVATQATAAEQAVKELNAQLGRVEQLITLKPSATLASESAKAIEGLRPIDVDKSWSAGKVKDLDETIYSLRQQADRLQSEVETKQSSQAALAIDQQLLDAAAKVRALAAEETGMAERREALQLESKRATDKERELEGLRQKLGPDWGTEELIGSSRPLPAPPTRTRLINDLKQAESRLEKASSDDELASEKCETANTEVRQHDTWLGEQYGIDLPDSELEAQVNRLNRLNDLRDERGVAERNHDEAVRALSTTPVEQKANPYWWVAGVVACAVLLLGIYALVVSDPFIGANLIVLGLFLGFLTFQQKPKPGHAANPDQLVGVDDQSVAAGSQQFAATARQRRDDVWAEADSIAADFDIDFATVPRSLIDGAIASIRGVLDRRGQQRQAQNVLEHMTDSLERANAALRGAIENLETTRREWVEFLRSNQLPEGATPAEVQELAPVLENARERKRELDDLQSSLAIHQTRSSDDDDQVASLLAELDRTDGVTRPSALLAQLESSEEAHREKLTLSESIAAKEQTLKQIQDDAKAEAQKRASLLDAVGVTDADSFELALKTEETRRQHQATIDEFERMCSSLIGAGRVDEVRTKVMQGDVSDWQAEQIGLQTQRDELEEQRNTLSQEVGRQRQTLEEVLGSDKVADAELRVNVAVERVRGLTDDWLALRIAEESVTRTLDYFEKERQPVVLQHAQQTFARFTGDRYDRINPGRDSEGFQVRRPDGATVDASRLSNGAKEQLYLAMRFGLIRETLQRKILPVILDDPMINSDPARSRRMADEIIKLANETQVLLFTSSQATADLFSGHGHRIDLTS